ncbi:MAG: NAD-dependent epimerase/dehydratase family protein [Flavobacteriales bacterium]
MKILFTGASSFTGFWFAKKLVEAGHEVHCTFTASSIDTYDDVRKLRSELLSNLTYNHFGIKFGDERFIALIEKENFDLLCHHAAYVTNYKSPEFDVVHAVMENTNNCLKVLQTLLDKGCKKMLLTGSVFEGGEGRGTEPLLHFSPYGLSKSLSAQIFEYYTNKMQFGYGKFVIPNPFGPFEEKRFTAYLINSWLKGEVPQIGTPDYVRDNIPVTLLADYYVHFCENLREGEKKKLSPSGICGSQGDFAGIVAREAGKRLELPCDYTKKVQTDFSEPMERLNLDKDLTIESYFDEQAFWDAFINFYRP